MNTLVKICNITKIGVGLFSLIVCITMGLSLTVYAGWELTTVETYVNNKGPGYGEAIQEINEWRYLDSNNEYIKSRDFIDIDGNIYTFNSDGYMIHDSTLDNKVFSSSGELINGLKRDESLDLQLDEWNDNDYHLIPKKFTGIFSMYAGLYATDYGFLVDHNGNRLTWYREYDHGYQIANEPQGYSEYVASEVKNLASKVSGEHIRDKVKSVLKIVGDRLDGDYQNILGDDASSLHKVLETGKATCMGYSLLAQRILEELGIQSELCLGHTKTGGYHMWIRTNIRGCSVCNMTCHHTEHWMYSDPSWYDGWGSGDNIRYDFYLDIPYDWYIDTYSMETLY